MKFARHLLGLVLLIAASAATSQQPLCNPCIDRPGSIRTTTVVESNTAPSRAGHIASRILELGGELRDIAHDCGVAKTKSYAQISFSVRACKWGGRYPALLVEPVSADDGSLVVLAASGSSVEVLFEDTASAQLVQIFSGLLKEDFDRMYQENSKQDGD